MTKSKKSAFTTALPWIICGLGALFYGYEYMLRLTPSVMTTELMRGYHINAAALGGLSAFYYYAYTPMQIPVGVLFDRYGPRKLLVFACVVCAIGHYFFGSPGHYAVAAAGRFLVGFGSAFAFVGVLKLATIWLPPERFALVSGMAAAIGTLTGMFGEIGLTSLVHSVGWHQTILISAVIGIFLAVFMWFIIKDGDADHKKLKKTSHINFRELGSDLMIILRNPQIWINGGVGCLIYLPTTAFAELWGIPYFENVFQFSPHQAAIAVSSLFLGFTIGAPFSGMISDHIKRRVLPMTIGGACATILMSMLIYMPHLSLLSVDVILFLLGMSYSTHVICFAVGREVSPANVPGTAIAVTNLLVMIGGVLFQPVIGVLLNMRWDGQFIAGVPNYAASDYQFALSVLPLGILVGTILTFFLRETRCEVAE